MTESLGTISSAPLWIDDAGSISVLESARRRGAERDKGLSMLVVDYCIDHRAAFGTAGRFEHSRSEGWRRLQFRCSCSQLRARRSAD